MKKNERLKALAAVVESLGLTAEEVIAYLGKAFVQSEKAKSADVVCPGMYYYSDRTISADILSDKQISGVVGWVDDSGRHGLVLGLREGKTLWAGAFKWCIKYAFDGIKSGEAFLPSKDELVKIFKNIDAIQISLGKIGQCQFKKEDSYWYWSSSKSKGCSAWVVRPYIDPMPYGGGVYYGNMYEENDFGIPTRVRCVLAF